MNYEVQLPRVEHIEKYAELGAKIHAESAFRHMVYDKSRIAALSYQIAKGLRKEFFARIIVDDKGEPVGIFLALLSEVYFGPDKVANDHLLALRQEHRTKCFPQIMQITDEYKDWAVKNGAKMVHLAQSTQIDIDKVEKVYELLGFPKTGTLHTIRYDDQGNLLE